MSLDDMCEDMKEAIDTYGFDNIVAWDISGEGIVPILSDEFLGINERG